MIRIDMGAALKLGAARGCDLGLRSEPLPAVKASLVEALSAERGHAVDTYFRQFVLIVGFGPFDAQKSLRQPAAKNQACGRGRYFEKSIRCLQLLLK